MPPFIKIKGAAGHRSATPLFFVIEIIQHDEVVVNKKNKKYAIIIKTNCKK